MSSEPISGDTQNGSLEPEVGRHQLELVLEGEVESCSYNLSDKRLTIRGARVFPEQILEYSQDIEILDMSGGEMKELPSDITKLEQLRVAFFSNNLFESVPKVIAGCRNLQLLGMKSCNIEYLAEDALPDNLRWLTLSDNKISDVPKSFGKLSRLEKLGLSGNQLTSLPLEMLGCRALRLIRLGSNQLVEVPKWLFELPDLAWYGDAGNPHNPLRSSEAYGQVSWSDIAVGEKIGESAQNVVHKGHILSTGETVAIKLFGGQVTSDGSPLDDINISLVAGNHKNLVGAHGLIVDHPEGRLGQILPLVPPTYRPLALPPSFDTCTRDVYPEGKMYSVDFIMRVISDVSLAGSHIHERGIMHGDIYGHNILVDQQGDSLLSDFGAASQYNLTIGNVRQLIDIHAFGYLIDDLLSRIDPNEDHGAEFSCLKTLGERCLSQNVSSRPLFIDVHQELANSI